jgi:hypothetical protein
MFVKKMQMTVVLIVLGAVMYSSAESMQQSDSIGRLPAIFVTASKYEYQDEAWLGMVEGVVVEARRSLNDIDILETRDEFNGMAGGSLSSHMGSKSIYSEDSAYLLVLLTLTLATLSILYMSLSADRTTREAKND